MAKGGAESRLAAIVAIDVAGYSRLMGADEEGTLTSLNQYPLGGKDIKRPTLTQPPRLVWILCVAALLGPLFGIPNYSFAGPFDGPQRGGYHVKLNNYFGLALTDIFVNGEEIHLTILGSSRKPTDPILGIDFQNNEERSLMVLWRGSHRHDAVGELWWNDHCAAVRMEPDSREESSTLFVASGESRKISGPLSQQEFTAQLLRCGQIEAPSWHGLRAAYYLTFLEYPFQPELGARINQIIFEMLLTGFLVAIPSVLIGAFAALTCMVANKWRRKPLSIVRISITAWLLPPLLMANYEAYLLLS